jgi:hypothetical protein
MEIFASPDRVFNARIDASGKPGQGRRRVDPYWFVEIFHNWDRRT